MTSLDATTAIPAIESPQRAARLADAGSAWTERIMSDAAKARLTYSVDGVGEGSVASRITAGRHVFLVDEPEALAGDDVAANPVEYALGALVSCQIVVYRLYAHSLGIVLDEIEVKAEADLDVRGLFGADPSVRPGFSAVRLAVTVTGPETQERYDELRATVDRHCPVLDILANPTRVTVTITKG